MNNMNQNLAESLERFFTDLSDEVVRGLKECLRQEVLLPERV